MDIQKQIDSISESKINNTLLTDWVKIYNIYYRIINREHFEVIEKYLSLPSEIFLTYIFLT